MTCDRPIRDRNGQALAYVCNLPKGHLGKCAQTFENGCVVAEMGDPVPCDGTFGLTVVPS